MSILICLSPLYISSNIVGVFLMSFMFSAIPPHLVLVFLIHVVLPVESVKWKFSFLVSKLGSFSDSAHFSLDPPVGYP
jgi:cation transporter-like permease